MYELLKGLPPLGEGLELEVAIERDGGEYGDSYVAITPAFAPEEAQVAAEADLSGAAARRRLRALLCRLGETRLFTVFKGAHHDYDSEYWLQYPQPEGKISRMVERDVDLSVEVLDELHPDWYFHVEDYLLDQTCCGVEPDTSILGQIFGTHQGGMDLLQQRLTANHRLRRQLAPDARPLDGFEPGFVLCEKDQRQLVYDLSDLYWRREILRRQENYSF